MALTASSRDPWSEKADQAEREIAETRADTTLASTLETSWGCSSGFRFERGFLFLQQLRLTSQLPELRTTGNVAQVHHSLSHNQHTAAAVTLSRAQSIRQ